MTRFLLCFLSICSFLSVLAVPAHVRANGNGSEASNADVQAYLNGHNSVRAQHGAVNLVWNNTLAAAAQQWADGCVFAHSQGQLGPYGGTLRACVFAPHGSCMNQFYSLQKTSQPDRLRRRSPSRPPSRPGLMRLVCIFPDFYLPDLRASSADRVRSGLPTE
jgi:hypothetical protein